MKTCLQIVLYGFSLKLKQEFDSLDNDRFCCCC